jgi:two-component system invasion response regulator UvrY
MITVMLVDDQELIRIGLKAVLSCDPAIEVVADLDNGLDALRQARALRPDVVVVDVDMPELSGVEVTARLVALSHPPQVVVLSVLTQPPWPQRLRAAGARGYVAKERASTDLREAIHAVYQGQLYFSPTLVSSLEMVGSCPGSDPLAGLSNRELEVFTLLVKGHSPEDLARLLHVSPKTIYSHRDRIRNKLGVNNDVEMTHLAIRYRLLNETVL